MALIFLLPYLFSSTCHINGLKQHEKPLAKLFLQGKTNQPPSKHCKEKIFTTRFSFPISSFSHKRCTQTNFNWLSLSIMVIWHYIINVPCIVCCKTCSKHFCTRCILIYFTLSGISCQCFHTSNASVHIVQLQYGKFKHLYLVTFDSNYFLVLATWFIASSKVA